MSAALATVKKQFEQDVSGHVLTVIRDAGVDRHLRFKRAGSSVYWFDVITWRGRLYIGGDCGTWVFSRLDDMFEFFRSDRGGINPGYWAEKLQATPEKGAEEFSKDRFREVIKDDFDLFVGEDGRGADWEQSRKDELWAEIENDVLTELDDNGHEVACNRAYRFSHDGFYFADFFEHRLTDFTHQYIWNCYAIVWAIARYDASKVVALPAGAAS